MKIAGTGWQGFALPFRSPYETSGSLATVRFGLLVFVRTENGPTGIGEASPVAADGFDAVAQTAAELERLSPSLLAKEVTGLSIDPLVSEGEISPALRFGLETALLDAHGKSLEVRLAELFGGRGATLAVNALIASESPQRAAEEARRAVAEGFRSLKLKVAHGDIENDEALVSATRGAVGSGVGIRIDANQGWDVPTAIVALDRLARYGVEYAEQPVPGVEGLAEVRRRVSIPVAADEAASSIEDVKRLLAAEAADVFIIKASRVGGLYRALEMARAVEAAGKGVVFTSSLESGVGVAATAHLAATLKQQPLAHGLATGSLFTGDLLRTPVLPVSGTLEVPRGAGLGIAIDEHQVSRYAINLNILRSTPPNPGRS